MAKFSGSENTCASDAFEVIEQLRFLNCKVAISRVVAEAFAGFGFQSFLMTRLPSRSERIDPYILLMSWPREWLLRYGRRGYYAHDPVAQTCFATLNPFVWSDASWKGCDPDRARCVMEEATEFDLSHGVMVPMHDLAGRQASLSMAGRHLDLPPSGLKAIHLVSLYAFASADDLSPARPLLTLREREVLGWTAEGKSAWEVGEILAIAETTVATHLKNAKQKLQGTTITHAVVQALRHREIKL